MEYNISDLLDCLREVSIDIQPKAGASAERIKELTMKKIHSENKSKRRSLSGFTKILVAAAILATLAVPVMAATGFHFTDWLEDAFSSAGEFNDSRLTGSASKNWDVSGWVFEIAGKEATPTGMTAELDQWDTVQEKSGKLTTDEGYWLEIWNGEAYEKLPEPSQKIDAGKTIAIEEGAHLVWDIDWSKTYGELEPGSYRLGKTVIYTSEAGDVENVECYAKFRIFPKDMTPYVESAKAAVEKLRTQDSYHITQTMIMLNESPDANGNYEKVIMNQWKHGNDFLIETHGATDSEETVFHNGTLLRDGVGYGLTWKGESVLTDITSWKHIDYLDDGNRDLWSWQLTVYDSMVGEVYGEENTTHIIMGSGIDGEGIIEKLSFTTDQAGNLIEARKSFIPSMKELEHEIVSLTLKVNNTSTDEIAKVIAAQTVDKPVSFSWAEEQAAHPAGSKGVKTEGFVNTASQGTVTLVNVVAIARKECTLEWQNTAVVFYDKIADMWKVELGYSQDDTVCQTVYLDANGITQLIVE